MHEIALKCQIFVVILDHVKNSMVFSGVWQIFVGLYGISHTKLLLSKACKFDIYWYVSSA